MLQVKVFRSTKPTHLKQMNNFVAKVDVIGFDTSTVEESAGVYVTYYMVLYHKGGLVLDKQLEEREDTKSISTLKRAIAFKVFSNTMENYEEAMENFKKSVRVLEVKVGKIETITGGLYLHNTIAYEIDRSNPLEEEKVKGKTKNFLNADEVTLALKMREEGHKYKSIANALGNKVSVQAIGTCIRKYNKKM